VTYFRHAFHSEIAFVSLKQVVIAYATFHSCKNSVFSQRLQKWISYNGINREYFTKKIEWTVFCAGGEVLF
jgi:hypothetical protein